MQNRFEQSIAWAEHKGNPKQLRFAGATQRGRSWAHDNNQDAYAIVTAPDTFVGVVCDGCSTAPSGYQSHNEVGAKILSKIISQYVAQTIRKTSIENFLSQLPKHRDEITKLLANAVTAICPFDDKDLFVKCYMMCTILVVATDGRAYGIFGCGDGIFFIDGIMTDLEEESGRYLSSSLFQDSSSAVPKEDFFKIHKTGTMVGIKTIMIASDGIADIAAEHPDILLGFLEAPAGQMYTDDLEPGYSPEIVKGFRRSVLKDQRYINWSKSQDTYDDRTFILVEHSVGQKPKAFAHEHGAQRPDHRVVEMAAEFSKLEPKHFYQDFGKSGPVTASLSSSSADKMTELTDLSYVEQKRREFVQLHDANETFSETASSGFGASSEYIKEENPQHHSQEVTQSFDESKGKPATPEEHDSCEASSGVASTVSGPKQILKAKKKVVAKPKKKAKVKHAYRNSKSP